MSIFAGILRVEDTNTALTAIDPQAISEGIGLVLARFQTERNTLQGLFVDSETDQYSERVRGGGFDEGQEIGPDGRPLETYVGGMYDVAFPLKRIGWALGWNDETFARMTVADLDREVASKTGGNAKRHMREIFRALMLKDNFTFVDELRGSLTIRRLANSDGTLYPPLTSATDEAQDNHYLVSGYAAGSMSATNNPFVTLANEVREHFGTTTRVVAFINTAQRTQVLTLLPNFTDVRVEGVTPAFGESEAINPGLAVPGDFLGVDDDSGVYVYVYDRVPADYIVGGAIDQARPLRRRVPAEASLRGFTVRAEETHFPFYKRTWIERFGYGVANRVSWAAMQLTTNGTYTDPAGL
ncbi:MAG TPA: hypothetical protein VM450_12375 [Thermomicrobiales bacterium]|nr:hypothetical protein [Thermomicrobiales bacterium]